MTSVILSQAASNDEREILQYLADSADDAVLTKYVKRFREVYQQLSQHPESGSLQPHLGKGTRMRVVAPYNVYTDYDETQDIVVILRVLHGSRKITRRMMRPR
ncbi:MAG TPA: hypothetical protein DCL54_02730 [Alphaproteobacteria bacterium]|nr:hypothetical protein [Alphaproteobacteria bacterium]HAJ45479.1 hypothetical protein [Alphaproteobacteria bacterium]